ncbi:hypothetical protein F383_26075 [Gossypium arboreum]|uniref:Uncharacterized protein n=1 Tax=Gossypium arboreum TaxID=29729 RepID=A0A0B0MPG1_GOSAR|nr:hypothetical protein F383_26075 [Gossypium arboreum]
MCCGYPIAYVSRPYFECSTGSSKGSSMSNLNEYVKDEKVSHYVQVAQRRQASSGIERRRRLNHTIN